MVGRGSANPHSTRIDAESGEDVSRRRKGAGDAYREGGREGEWRREVWRESRERKKTREREWRGGRVEDNVTQRENTLHMYIHTVPERGGGGGRKREKQVLTR